MVPQMLIDTIQTSEYEKINIKSNVIRKACGASPVNWRRRRVRVSFNFFKFLTYNFLELSSKNQIFGH